MLFRSDASSLVTYLDCGKNLMDELMPWATYEAGKPMEEAKPRMTLDDVYALADKGKALTWADLLAFEGRGYGSGLLIGRFPINNDYCLEAFGGELDGSPWRVQLLKADENGEFLAGRPGLYIDFFTQDIDTFLSGAQTQSITVTSGGVTIEPYSIMRFSETWTEYGQVAADGMPIELELAEHTEEIPALRLDGELRIWVPTDTSFLAFYMLDPQDNEPLMAEELCNAHVESAYVETVTAPRGLSSGRYLCYFRFVRACNFNSAKEQFDTLGDDCYFWLEIPER